MAGPKLNYPRMDDAAQRRRKALDMVRAGKRYAEIVDSGLYSSTGAVSNAVRGAMELSRQEMFTSAELYRAQQLERLNEMLAAIWDDARAGSLPHIAEARRIVSDIGDLTGAKAPIKYEFGEGDVDHLLARVERELERLLSRGAEETPAEVVDGEVLELPGGEG